MIQEVFEKALAKINLHIVVVLIVFSILIVGKQTIAFDANPNEFVGPKPGLLLKSSNSSGLTVEVHSEWLEDNVLLVTEVFCGFSHNNKIKKNTPKGYRSISSQYTLKVEEQKLIMEMAGVEFTLIDFAAKNWTVPGKAYGNFESNSFLAICKITSVSEKQILGEQRRVAVVQCDTKNQLLETTSVTWEIASGLGLLSRGDYTLTSIEKLK
ncbi:hypothetical protein [Desulfovibrio sp. Fe33]|uniref:hypothetical protein n=1 Tax=Desulfovibrio sp. Fe33 TaxID=3020842 RepID=UPI00234D3762|nr:hypothetical protein [Desulfovibrio sp. Fe33]